MPIATGNVCCFLYWDHGPGGIMINHVLCSVPLPVLSKSLCIGSNAQ